MDTDERIELETEILQTWDQAGDHPWDYIVELGFGDTLLEMLGKSTFSLKEYPLYRGTTRNLDIQPGDIKDYSYPSS